MTRNIIIKLLIALLVLSLSYSIFWFFKIGQIEKRIAKFVSDNNVYVSSGEIKMSGFPLSQNINIKDFKFRIPSKTLSKNQIIVSDIKAKSSIFNNNFELTITEAILEDENGNLLKISFTKNPSISIATTGQSITLNYKDDGYEILDANQNHLYSAQSSLIKIASEIQGEGKISIKVTSDIKQINGFDISDFYKNVFEQSIVKGIQTEKIKLGSSEIKNAVNPMPETVNQPEMPQNIEENLIKPTPSSEVKKLNAETAKKEEANLEKTPLALEATELEANAPIIEKTPELETASNVEIVEEDLLAKTQEPIKSDFILDAEYTLIPNNSDQASEEEFDPMKIQDLPLQYSKYLKINNAIFSNQSYKITVSGNLNSVPDDSMPFGNLIIQVEQLEGLLGSFKEYLVKTLGDKGYNISEPTATEILADEILEDVVKTATSDIVKDSVVKTDIAIDTDNTIPTNSTIEPEKVSVELEIKDPYDNFLKKIFDNLDSVTNELALKNTNSNPSTAEFNLKREKNLEFLVNDSSIREILGKF